MHLRGLFLDLLQIMLVFSVKDELADITEDACSENNSQDGEDEE